MYNTKEALKKQRGLYVIIAVLLVVWMLEPSIAVMSEVCRNLFNHFTGL